MKKILLFLFLFACLANKGISQTYLKGNATYWALAVTNVSLETRLANKWTFNGDLVFSPWKSFSGNPLLMGQIILEPRFYPRGAFKGFYVGGFGAFQIFKMSKWNYINTGKYQKGRGFALGATIGYEVQINERWGVDIFAGGGWQNSQYRGYYTKTGEMYKGWNGSGEWLPYKIGVSFAYRLGKINKK